MAKTECSSCGHFADARCMETCIACSRPVCDECAAQNRGYCRECYHASEA